MKFCCTLGFVHPDHLVRLAVAAEAAGFETVTIADHVVHPVAIRSRYPYSTDGERGWDHTTPWPDPFVATMAMAAHTTRLRFSQGVFILPMRDPFTVAKAVGTCARLSGYRVRLGIGLGWMADEFELLGHPFEERAPRSDEMITVLRKLWTGELVEHHGRFYDFGPLSMVPGVEQPIPIIVGGVSKPALRRVAALGDGWAPAGLTIDQVADATRQIRADMAGRGRGSDPLEVFAACPDATDLAGYRRMDAAGISHVVLKPWARYGKVDRTGVASPAEMEDGIRRFGEEVIAAFPPADAPAHA
ncbi:MAG: TIGR03619 family F420-dependent LLM class oxidoreductase [Deltaproteobacteria bacterium]|nr:TIGR03619 family F420-dependent LLM class oxidoreductase [Deltaproteobacteria bacterium]